MPAIIAATGHVSEVNPNHVRNGPSTRKMAAINAPIEVAASTMCGREVLYGNRDERIRKITRICVAMDSSRFGTAFRSRETPSEGQKKSQHQTARRLLP